MGDVFGRWVLAKRKGISRSRRIGSHCLLVKYAGADEVAIERIIEATASGSTKQQVQGTKMFNVRVVLLI